MLTYEEAEKKAAAIPPSPNHIGPGCGRGIIVFVPTRFSARPVVTGCGSTGLSGAPEFCEACYPKFAHRDWRREAEENGETWDEDY